MPEEFEVVDGQQRLSAIWEFLDGELKLPPKIAEKYGGPTYDDLPDAVSDAFDDFEIEYDEITSADEEELKEFFQRLQEGLPLTSSEKLNAVHSKLRDYCVKLAKHKFFSETTVVRDKRYAFFDIVAKVMTLEIEGLDGGLRYEDVKNVFDSNANFSGRSAVARRVSQALTMLHEAFQKSTNMLRNRTIVQSIISLSCRLLDAGMKPAHSKVLCKFVGEFLIELNRQVELGVSATDPDYLAFQRTVNANVKSGPRTRQNILIRKLFSFDPTFYDKLSSLDTAACGITASNQATAQRIRDLVADINEEYGAKFGKDLFKPTNKTTKALTSLGKPVDNYDKYKTFVEHLYFLFRESTGTRLEGILPESFADVNDLRTMLQHDVDHGKAAKVRSKRRKLGLAFMKYAGATNPKTVDPQRFVVIQSNLVNALEADLRVLRNKYS